MKLYFLIHSLSNGGAERNCVTLANCFVALGDEVEIIVLNLNDADLRIELDDHIKIVDLNVNHARTSLIPLMRYVRAHKPDKVLVFSQQLAIVLLWVRFLLRHNFKIFSRNINTLSQAREYNTSFWHKYIVKKLVKINYFHVDKIISQSNKMKKDLLDHYGIKPDKICVIYNPVNPSIESNGSKVPVIPLGKRTYFLFAGRLEPQKGLEYLIEAFAIANSRIPNLNLKIAGEGSERNKLLYLIKERGIQQHVQLLGYQENLIPLYQGAIATLLTSRYEGLPNVLIESIALGTPVIAFDCPSGPSEIIVEGENGYLVESFNINAFAYKLVNIVRETPFHISRVRRTAEKFHVTKIASQYRNVLLDKEMPKNYVY